MTKHQTMFLRIGVGRHSRRALASGSRPVILAAAVMAGAFQAPPASAQSVAVHRGTLQQFCQATYQPRGIQAIAEIQYSGYGPQLLCRLPGTQFGYTLHNHSFGEVCAYLTGSSASQNQNGQIVCLGGQTNPIPAFNPNARVYSPNGGYTTRCAWANGGYIC